MHEMSVVVVKWSTQVRVDRERKYSSATKHGKRTKTKNSGVLKEDDLKSGLVHVYLNDSSLAGVIGRHRYESHTATLSNIPIKDQDKKPFGDGHIPVAIRGPWG